jgi:two-component system, chemotaxis family, response regulator Rcp1
VGTGVYSTSPFLKGRTKQMTSELVRSRPAEILLAEDDENDVELTRQGFKKCKLLLNLHHVKDGVECMAFLHKQGKYSAAPTPDLLLLDINMPRMGGLEVLAEMVADETLNAIPVVVLTTSAQDEEILKMYKLRRARTSSSRSISNNSFTWFGRLPSTGSR